MLTKRNIRYLVPLIIIVVLLLVFPQITSNTYYLRVLVTMFYLVVLAASLRLIMNTGQLSMGHYAFMGIGAYTSAILVTRMHWNFWGTIFVAGFMGAAVAVVLGLIVLRIHGVYFAIVTFAVSEVIRLVFVQWKSFFGGAGGILNIPSPNALFGVKFGGIGSFYYLGLVLMLFVLIIVYRLDRSRYGMTFSAIASADTLAESIGINTMRYKVLAFTLGAFMAGMAGAFYASLLHYINPDDFAFGNSMTLIVYVIVGGAASFWGPLVGVFVLGGLPVVLQQYIPHYNPQIQPLILGVFLLATMIFIPEGFVGIPSRLVSLFRGIRKAKPKVVVSPGEGSITGGGLVK